MLTISKKPGYVVIKAIKYCILASVIIISSCTSNEITDPFWNINLDLELSNINEILYKKSNEGEIVNCVFSFDKDIYTKTKDFDAKLNLSLEYPRTINNELKLNYTIVAEFKNEEDQSFNPAFFDYFLDVMKSSYGNNWQEEKEKNLIHLQWNDESNIHITVSVVKDINLYMVSIIRRN